MDKNKIHGFMDHLNLFFVGLIIGGIVGACFSMAEKKVKAYEKYYKCTETLLDSLDGTHDLDLKARILSREKGR